MSRVTHLLPTEELIQRFYQLYTSLDNLDGESFEHYVGVACTACRTSPPSRIDLDRIRNYLGDTDATTIFLVGLEELTAQLHELFHEYRLYRWPGETRLDYRFERLSGDDIMMARIESPKQSVSILELMQDDNNYPRI
jgi:hypothetical protein